VRVLATPDRVIFNSFCHVTDQIFDRHKENQKWNSEEALMLSLEILILKILNL
jgi:hypothetical protein